MKSHSERSGSWRLPTITCVPGVICETSHGSLEEKISCRRPSYRHWAIWSGKTMQESSVNSLSRRECVLKGRILKWNVLQGDFEQSCSEVLKRRRLKWNLFKPGSAVNPSTRLFSAYTCFFRLSHLPVFYFFFKKCILGQSITGCDCCLLRKNVEKLYKSQNHCEYCIWAICTKKLRF